MCHFALKVSLMIALVSVAACGQDMSQDMNMDMNMDMSMEGIIRSAVSAGPASITDEAAVSDWDMSEVRAGTNGWTCLPDRPDTDGNDPWCVNGPWPQLPRCVRESDSAQLLRDRVRLHADGRQPGQQQ